MPDGQFGTREVSEGTLKLKVVNVGEKQTCTNLDKFDKQHPDTQYMAGRIISKNLQEYVKGKWTARLRVPDNGQASMFPAWWLLGAENNEPPVQEADENVCWPMTGSGEIDIFEHHGDHHADHFTTGDIHRVGIFLGFVWLATRAERPHEAHVRGAKRNRIDRHWGWN